MCDPVGECCADGKWVGFNVRANRMAQFIALLDEAGLTERQGNGIRLLPENDAFEPIFVPPETDGFSIAGKVVGLMRRF